MSRLNHYEFHSEWTLPIACEPTWAALRDLPAYARWWPEVRSVIPIDADRAAVLIMGILPYSLEFILEREVDDKESGILRARLTGDLEGFSNWTVQSEGEGCRIIYDQEVHVRKALLRTLAPVARPVFRLNHALMMMRGRHGLGSYLDSTG